MAFTNVSLVAAGTGAVTPVAADGSNGNKFTIRPGQRLLIHNPDEESLTVTFAIPAASDARVADNNAIADYAESFSDEWFLIKELGELYKQVSGADQGAVTFTWTGTVTNVVVLLIG